MANISVTYSFTNGTTADADQVNQNFTDIINGTSDGSKDFSINALTVAGTLTANGSVVLGNASGDDITMTGSLASSIPIKTTNTYNIGSSTLGLASVYFGANSQTVRVLASSSAAATYTITLPTAAGSSGQYLRNNGSGTLIWSATGTPNYTIAATVAASALTVALKDPAGSDATSSTPITINFRNATLATGDYAAVSATGAMSVVVPSTATMGWTSGDTRYVFVYAINNAGTMELAVASQMLDENALHTTTTVDTSSDSLTGKYSTTGRSSIAVRYLGKVLMTQATAGTWATAPSEISTIKQPTNATAMDDAEATRNGRKIYVHGTTYNNGAAPTLSGPPAVFVVTSSAFIPYQMQDGSWRLKFNFEITHGSATVIDTTINGVTFSADTPVEGYAGATNETRKKATGGSSSLILRAAAAATGSQWAGDVPLSSKPTWAY
jgi:hypothetical protein